MKYMLICTAVFLLCFGCGAVLAAFLGKRMNGNHVRRKKIFITLFTGLILCTVVTFGYLQFYYHAVPEDLEQASQNPMVKREEIPGGYFFDGPGENIALVFYPGAKVESLAYAPLLTQMAERGIDCFLAEVPFHMAIFGSNAVSRFIESYSYDTWLTAGHSMGGIVASGYAASHPEEIQGVVMLASYPTKKLGENITYCSIYGNKDGCLNLKEYDKAKSYWPAKQRELCMEGGNHAQFGCYGAQKGDGEADLSAEEQRKLTVDFICDAIFTE